MEEDNDLRLPLPSLNTITNSTNLNKTYDISFEDDNDLTFIPQPNQSSTSNTSTNKSKVFDITTSFTMPNDVSDIPHAHTEAEDKLGGWTLFSGAGDNSRRTFLSTTANSNVNDDTIFRPKTSSPVVPQKKFKTEPFYENIHEFQAGTYKVHIELEQLWLKSKEPLTTDFYLSLSYPPFGIEKSAPLSCLAKKDPLIPFISGSPYQSDSGRKCALVYSGHWDIVKKIEQLSTDLLHQPILVEVRLARCGDTRSAPFAVVEIPFGEIFNSHLSDDKRILNKSSDLQRLEDLQKIGCLNYSIELSEVYTMGESLLLLDQDKDARDGLMKIHKSPKHLQLSKDDPDDRSKPVVVNKKSNKADYWIQWKINEMNRFQEELKDKELHHLEALKEEWDKKNRSFDIRNEEIIHDYNAKTGWLSKKSQRLDEEYNKLLEDDKNLVSMMDKSLSECSGLLINLENQLYILQETFDTQMMDLDSEMKSIESECQIWKNKYLALKAKYSIIKYDLQNLHGEEINVSGRSRVDKVEREWDELSGKVTELLNQVTKKRSTGLKDKRRHPLMKKKLDNEHDKELFTAENPSLASTTGKQSYKVKRYDKKDYPSIISSEKYHDSNEYDDKDSEVEEEKVTTRYQGKFTDFETHENVSSKIKDQSRRATISFHEEPIEPDQKNLMKPNLDVTYLTADFIQSLGPAELSKEIERVTNERNRLVGCKTYSYSDPYVRKLENSLTHLASVFEFKRETGDW